MITRSRPVSTRKARSRLARSSSSSSPASETPTVSASVCDFLSALAGDFAVEREQVVGLTEFLRLEDLVFAGPEVLGQLGDRRAAAELDRQLVARAIDGEIELLQAARHLDGPALVAKVSFDLADDRRRRIGRELDAAFQIEAIDGLEQSDRADLHQVVERLAAIRKPHREKSNQVEVHDDELVAQSLVLGVRRFRVVRNAAGARG